MPRTSGLSVGNKGSLLLGADSSRADFDSVPPVNQPLSPMPFGYPGLPEFRDRGPRRWRTVLFAVVGVITLIGIGFLYLRPPQQQVDDPAAAVRGTSVAETTTTSSPIPPAPPADTRKLSTYKNISGAISPKSVVSSGHGLVSAQNMMYRHSVTTYDADGANVATIADDVTLDQFGVTGHPGVSKGAPVEAAFNRDGTKLYVSNYSMYGAGFSKEADDDCTPKSGYSASYLYRIDTKTNVVEAVAAVGVVPKYVAMTPDDRFILTTNWCSWDLSVVDAATMTEVKRVPLDAYPRGIVVSPDSRTAYVAVMGARSIAKVDLVTYNTTWVRNVGGGPRHVVIDPQGAWLYVTLNADGNVLKMDTTTNAIVGRVKTGKAPRSMAISNDGTALYVVNYDSNTVSKVRTGDMTVLQDVATGTHPIGIAYEPTRHRVWVAIYSGNILVLNDT